MRGWRFGIGAWALSFAGAAFGAAGAIFGAFLATPGHWGIFYSPGERILWNGCFLAAIFVGGFLGLNLWMAFHGRYKIRRPRGWISAFLLAVLLLFGAGAGGQALFMYSKEEVTSPATVDMVLLLDASGSMDSAGYIRPRTDAACRFVDSLEEECRLSAIAFASAVSDSSPLAFMDDQGKTDTKDFIRSIDSVGTTDFNAPLRAALDMLESQGRVDCRKAVFLLTDGEGDLSDDVIGDYLNSDVMVYTIRIDTYAAGSLSTRALAEFAADTGGFDTWLKPNTDGSVDTADMLEAFQNAFRSSTETKVTMCDEPMLIGGRITAYQFFVRLVTLSVCSLLFGVGYFGRLQRPAVFYNLLCGAVWSGLIFLCSEGKHEIHILLLCVLMASAFVHVDLDGGEVIDI